MPGIALVPFDRTYLDLSWQWLRDPEIKRMTMSPDFTREEQLAFFNGLPSREDYKIWGLEAPDGTPIGAAGLKHIDGTGGEVFLYIGERDWWGRGAGPEILDLCEQNARALGLDHLVAIVSSANGRSVRAFEKAGYSVEESSSTADVTRMTKSLR